MVCVELSYVNVFALHRNRYQHRFPHFVLFQFYLCLSGSRAILIKHKFHFDIHLEIYCFVYLYTHCSTFKTNRGLHLEVGSIRMLVEIKVEEACRIAIKFHLQNDEVKYFQKLCSSSNFSCSYQSIVLLNESIF